MGKMFRKLLALLLALCLLCGGAGLAEAVKADNGTIRQVQEALNAAGFDCGTPDGVSGKKTRSAIQEYQAANGLAANGEITEELLSHMGIELPGAEETEGAAAELKEVKGNSPVRSVRIPICGPAYVSNFDSETLLHVPYLRWNLRIRAVGRVVDLRGLYPVEQQKAERAILIQAADGSLFLADYTKSFIAVPDFQLGDQLTVSGSVGETRLGMLQHPTPDYTYFYWDWITLEDYQQNVIEGHYDGMSLEPTGDEALTIQADAVELGDQPAPTVKFESIALAPEHRLGTVVKDTLAGLDVDAESGWLFFGSYEQEKGFGESTPLINYYTGMVIPYSAFAPAYLCDECILQFEWRDAATGAVVDPDTALHTFYEYVREGQEYDAEKYGAPRVFQMYAKVYDFDGNLQKEQLVGDNPEDDKGDAYAKVQSAMDALCRECGAHLDNWNFKEQKLLDNRELLEFVDENGDAVAYDSNGNELIRYPGTDASKLEGMLLKAQGIITVSYKNSNGECTEVFIPDGDGNESAAADEAVWIEKNVPLPSRSASEAEDSGNSKYTSNFDYIGFLAGYSVEENVRIVGTVTDLNGEMPLEAQKEAEEIYLIAENDELFSIDIWFAETEVEVPDYQIGDTLTVCGRAMSSGTIQDIPIVGITPDFIATGDVPAPEE